MRKFLQPIDIASQLVIVTTFVLFVVALFIKGFDHGLLLAAGSLPVKFSDQRSVCFRIVKKTRNGSTCRPNC